jgi:methionyl-tRNA formyltransferase
MRIVFMGTPDFALPSLKSILESSHQVVGVVTQPDKPKGRGLALIPTPVKKNALENNLFVLTPEKLKDENFLSELKRLSPELIVVVAFRILPEEVFLLPPLGTINLHASLLPKYRGAAPINWALINGETKTGLTTFFIQKEVDTGNIILQKEVDILPEESFGELYERLSVIGALVLMETLELIEKGNYVLKKQDEVKATKAPKITPELGKIDWSKSAVEIKNLIRGLCPEPCAYTTYKNKILKIYKSSVLDENENFSELGKVIFADKKNGIGISTKKGILKLLEVQPESKKRITGDEFLRGYRVQVGEFLGG